MAQDTELLLAKYLNNDFNLIADDLQHLRWRFNKKEIEDLPLVKINLRNQGEIQGFLISHEKTNQNNQITLEYTGDDIGLISTYAINTFSISNIKNFAHYFIALPKENIAQTASLLSIKQTVAKLESILLNEGIHAKLSYNINETFTSQELWLYQQLITDLCMSIVEACQQAIVKDTFQKEIKTIEFKVGEKNTFQVKQNGTLCATLSFQQTQSTRSQRATIIEQLMSIY